MPVYWKQGPRYYVSYITSPSHVRLGLTFDKHANAPSLTCEPAIGKGPPTQFDEEKIVEAVLAGVYEVNLEHNRHLNVTDIAYVADDSPRYSLYQHCAKLIAERVVQGGDFPERLHH